MSSKLQEFQEKEFNQFLKSKANGLVVFGAPWCVACKMLTPMLEKIADKNKDISFIKIDVSKSPGLASRMGVMSLPNILLIKKGKVADQIVGTTTKKEIESKLK